MYVEWNCVLIACMWPWKRVCFLHVFGRASPDVYFDTVNGVPVVVHRLHLHHGGQEIYSLYVQHADAVSSCTPRGSKLASCATAAHPCRYS